MAAMTQATPFEDTRFHPWWWETAPRPARADRPLSRSVDILIIGSGITGLHAALVLARRGREVAVVDTGALGHGASSRNGGQVGTGNQRFRVAELIRRYGQDRARALILEGTKALEFTARFIKDEAIACGFERVGRFRGAVHPKHYDEMARDMDAMHAISGTEFHMVSRSEQDREIGTDRYYGGAVLPQDACVHPALYHQGLVDAAEEAGARLISHIKVTRLAVESDLAVAFTQRGRVEARQVLVATNGYTGTVTPNLRRRVVPIGSAIIATESLPPEVMKKCFPTRRVIGDTSRVYFYYRPCPKHERVLFGGRVKGFAPTDDAGAFTHLYEGMAALFPDLRGAGVSHAWTGYVAYTRRTLPHSGRIGKGPIFHALGYCGSGVARASYLGHRVARRMLGDPDAATAWDELSLRPFPGHFLHPIAVPGVTAWKRLRDRIERPPRDRMRRP